MPNRGGRLCVRGCEVGRAADGLLLGLYESS